MKVVLDTNVVIAAFATHGLCHLILESVLAHHEYFMSPNLLAEIQSKLKTKLKMPETRVREITSFLKHHSTFIKDMPVAGLECRDPDDIKILALSINAKAEMIVTGDQDLLVLKNVKGVEIVSPREFWTLIRGIE